MSLFLDKLSEPNAISNPFEISELLGFRKPNYASVSPIGGEALKGFQ